MDRASDGLVARSASANKPRQPAADATPALRNYPVGAAGTDYSYSATVNCDQPFEEVMRDEDCSRPETGSGPAADAVAGAASAETRKPKRGGKQKSLTPRSVEHMRKYGWTCEVVEHYNSFVKRKFDLFGFIDVLCVRGDKVVGVQATSWDEVNRRIEKITSHDNYDLIKRGIPVIVHGWKKVAGRWICKEVEL